MVKVALRQRESLAVLRVRDRVIMLQTLLWPDEVRGADFPILKEDVELRPQEMRMAASLVDSMSNDFEPDAFEDDYQKALVDLVEAKLEGAPPAPVQSTEEASTEVVDLLFALQASVDRARAARGESPAAADGDSPAPVKKTARQEHRGGQEHGEEGRAGQEGVCPGGEEGGREDGEEGTGSSFGLISRRSAGPGSAFGPTSLGLVCPAPAQTVGAAR